MSRINVENIRHPDAASDSLQLSDTGNITAPGNLSVTGTSTLTGNVTASGNLSVTGTSTLTGNTVVTGSLTANGLAYPTAGPLSNRNLIINGAMRVAQRGTQVTGITNSGYRTVDRFRPSMGTLGTWTIEQSTDAPDGFAHSHKFTCTTADASPAAGDDIEMEYRVEAQDLQHLNYGSASAQAMTLSFWVKSNKTGTATVNILQPDNSNKSLSPTYTISSADTWEHKTISIPGDTAGVINNDNGNGLWFLWWLNSGSNFNSGTNRTTWTTLNSADRNASNLGVGGAVDDYWQITGVQLEVGSVATPFEHKSFGDELRRCKRYFERRHVNDNGDTDGVFGYSNSLSTTSSNFILQFEVEKRANASVSLDLDGGTLFQRTSTGNSVTTTQSITVSSANTKYTRITLAGSSFTSGGIGQVRVGQSGSGNAFFDFDAEL